MATITSKSHPTNASQMAGSGQPPTRSSARKASTTPDEELFKKAEKAVNDLRQFKNLDKTAKLNVATLIDELVEKAKQTITGSTTTGAISKETFEKETQTDPVDTGEPIVTIDKATIHAIDKKQDFIITMLQKTHKTYAQAAASPATPWTGARPTVTTTNPRLSKARSDRIQYEISLTVADAPKTTQDTIQMENHKQITKRLQETIDNAKLEGAPQIEEIAKLRRGVVRLRATTKEGAKSIREGQVKWEEAYSGVKIYKPKYGIVIHRVPTWAIDLKPGYENTSDYVETIEEWQQENASRNNITISGIKPLARKPKIEDGHKRFQSIIIFTEHADAADRCITNNFLIGSQSFPVEKYAPHLRVTQCFKCYGFGHTASNCNNKEQCG